MRECSPPPHLSCVTCRMLKERLGFLCSPENIQKPQQNVLPSHHPSLSGNSPQTAMTSGLASSSSGSTQRTHRREYHVMFCRNSIVGINSLSGVLILTTKLISRPGAAKAAPQTVGYPLHFFVMIIYAPYSIRAIIADL